MRQSNGKLLAKIEERTKYIQKGQDEIKDNVNTLFSKVNKHGEVLIKQGEILIKHGEQIRRSREAHRNPIFFLIKAIFGMNNR